MSVGDSPSVLYRSPETELEAAHSTTFSTLLKQTNKGICAQYRCEAKDALKRIWESKMLLNRELVRLPIPTRIYPSEETTHPFGVVYDKKLRSYIITGIHICRGGFKSSQLALCVQSRRWHVLSEITAESIEKWQETRDEVEEEVLIHSSVSHPNIVRLVHSFERDLRFILITPFCKRENLDTYLDTHPAGFSYRRVVDLTTQIVDGLMYLDRMGIVHNDVKGPNIFLKKTKKGFKIKIGDFGLARLKSEMQSNPVLTGTLYCTPPSYIRALIDYDDAKETLEKSVRSSKTIQNLFKNSPKIDTMVSGFINKCKNEVEKCANDLISTKHTSWQVALIIYRMLKNTEIGFVTVCESLNESDKPDASLIYLSDLTQADVDQYKPLGKLNPMEILCFNMLKVKLENGMELNAVQDYVNLEKKRVESSAK